MKGGPSCGAVCAALCCASVVMIPGVICYAVGQSYMNKYDPSARQNEINAYSNAMSAWKAGGFNSGSQQWAALGGFNVSVDFTVAAALTDAAIEPYAVETGADIVPYADRAAFTTSGSTLFSPSTRTYPGSGNKNVEIVVRRTNGALVLRRTVAVVIELTEQATTSCERDDDNNGGSSTTCTNSCNRGRLSGSTCYMYVHAASTGGGVCFALHPDTLAYDSGCAIMSESAAFLLNGGGGGLLGSFPNKVGDVSYDDYTDDPVTPWPDVPVVIRSSADPWVVAAAQTSGYMRFGAVNALYAAVGDSLRKVGIALMVTPPLLLLCCCCCVCLCAILDTADEKDAPNQQRKSFSQHVSRRFTAIDTRVNNTTRASLRQVSMSVGLGGSGKSPISSEPGPAGIADGGDGGDPTTSMELPRRLAPVRTAPDRVVADARGIDAGVNDEDNPKSPANAGGPSTVAAASAAPPPPTVSVVNTLPAGTDAVVLQPASGVAAAPAGDASYNNSKPPPYSTTHTLVL